jgi:hypothetical protein
LLLLAHSRWFSPGTLASPTTKTGRHDIAEILLKVASKHQNSNKIKYIFKFFCVFKVLLAITQNAPESK